MRLAVPAVGPNSRAGLMMELASQQGHNREQSEQTWSGASHGMVRPLPLRLHTQMGASLLEGNLDLPAQNEPADDLDRIALRVGAQQGLRREAAEGIAQQHPAEGNDRSSAMTPHGRGRAKLHHAISFAIPARHRDSAPACARLDQHISKGWQASAFGARPAAGPWPA